MPAVGRLPTQEEFAPAPAPFRAGALLYRNRMHNSVSVGTAPLRGRQKHPPTNPCLPRNHSPYMTYKNIYFIGIGGIGMSALARYFRHEGCAVSGYDRTPSPLTAELEAEGIAVHYDDNTGLIPDDIRQSPPAETLVVYTPAVPADHSELQWFRANGYEVLKRSRTLGIIGAHKRVMAVAGTHGKTSTTTMAAWFNTRGAGQGSAFLGGISKNFGSNLVLGPGERLAVEADEFDRSFLQLEPQAAVITSTDADHLDIYGNAEAFAEAFEAFARQIKPGGTLITKEGIGLSAGRIDIGRYTYSLDDKNSDFHAENLTVDTTGHYTFDLVLPDHRIDDCRLGIPGAVNVENCVAAAALCWTEGFTSDDNLKEAIATFSGVRRRFDFHVNTPQVVYMDDYAHHPTELAAMLTSVRGMFPGRSVTLVFQPHLYTRTRDFAPAFTEALSLADHLLLLPIYPAREEPIEGVSSEMLLRGIHVPGSSEIVQKEELIARLSALDFDILVTAGAGDIDRFCEPIAALVRQRVAEK